MSLLTLGVSHHTAPVDTRSRLAFAESEQAGALGRLRGLAGVAEAALLSTCNRTEITTVGEPEALPRVIEWWQRERQAPAGLLQPHLYVHRDRGSIAHSLRVACGLDSLVLGEPQILGQMKQTFEQARGLGTLGPVLSRLFQHAFAVAKQVRTETAIGAHPVSVAYAAVQMAGRIFETLQGKTAVLVGAGETIRLFGQHLRRAGVGRIVVVNRSLERAQDLAAEWGGQASPLADLSLALIEADLVVSSTAAPGFVVERHLLEQALRKRRRKPVFMIDLAIPADIDPRVAELPDVYLYTLDDLKQLIEHNRGQRRAAADEAEEVVAQQTDTFARWLDSRDAAGTIQSLRAHGHSLRDASLARALKRLKNGEDPEAALRWLADHLTNQHLHAPSQQLRHADTVEQALLLPAARQLFALDATASDAHPSPSQRIAP